MAGGFRLGDPKGPAVCIPVSPVSTHCWPTSAEPQSLIQMPLSDWGGPCGMPAISPRTITLSKWGKPTINSRRQPTADMLPETIGPRLLLTPVPLSLSCQNSIFLYASCCVSKPGLQQQITTNLKKQREVYSVTVLETRCPKSRCQQG